MPDPKKVPLGKPLELTDEQLEQLSEVTPADIEKAKVSWRSNAPEKFKDLLDAQTVESDE